MPDWNQKVIVVTGGSSGFGVAIARQFAAAGARVVCLARDAQKLAEVAERFERDENLVITTVVADVTDDQSVANAVATVKETFGQIDGWVNNVGKSLRIALADATVEDFASLMEINFYSAVRCARAVMPELERSHGHLINIGSLASKTGWPSVAPYSASKHALAAWHHQLRLEGDPKVHYLHVCPGPIRRHDSATRYSDQAAGLPDAANQPGAGVKVKGLEPDYLAEQIRIACERRKPELVLPWKARIAFSLAQLSPRLGDWLLKKFSK